jgi:predicted ATP-grasp superfamily ATP-dependent carboligase
MKVPGLIADCVGIQRCLADAGIPSIVASEYPKSPAFWSRHCIDRAVLPNVGERPDDALRVFLEIGRRHPERPVLMAGRESDVGLYSARRDDLAPFYRLKLAPPDLLRTMNNKVDFAALAERHRLSVPKTIVVRTDADLARAAGEHAYPCVAKPFAQGDWLRDEVYAVVGRWTKAMRVHDRSQLAELFARLRPHTPGFLVQEWIDGDDTDLFSLHAYCPEPGRITGHFLGRKIRTEPPGFGRGSYTRSWSDPAIARVGLEALEAIGYVGAAGINLKRDPGSGRVAILEINPRFSLWCHLAARCGVNLPLAMYNDCLGLPPPKLSQSPVERRWLFLAYDFQALAAYRRQGTWTIGSWLRSLLVPRLQFWRFDLRDPLPALRATGQFFWLRFQWRWTRLRRKFQ